jgi:hypothetical protein
MKIVYPDFLRNLMEKIRFETYSNFALYLKAVILIRTIYSIFYRLLYIQPNNWFERNFAFRIHLYIICKVVFIWDCNYKNNVGFC